MFNSVRPDSGSSSSIFSVIVAPTVALALDSSGASPCTLTFSARVEIVSVRSERTVSPLRNTRLAISEVWNPVSSTRTRYVAAGRAGME